MAQYYSEADYCAEERSRPYANPGFCHGEGGERYPVRKEAYEVDEVALAGRGHHGHLGHSGSHLGHSGGYEGHLGHREHHGHGGRRYDARGSTYDSCTGQY